MTQGAFSFLRPLTDEQIERQVRYAIAQGWPIGIEYSDESPPPNSYWEMWGLPLFDAREPGPIMERLREARAAHPDAYIKINAYDSRPGRQTVALSFIVDRPQRERAPGTT
jgi:ribulose-bisphosphate carboxylase small chain